MGSKVFWYSERQSDSKGISWSRGGHTYGYSATLKNVDKVRSTLQFQIKFPYDNDTVYLSYSLPYTYSDLMRHIAQWKLMHPRYFSSETLCQTLGGRPCPILTVTAPGITSSRDCLFLTGRIHPGESNGSVVLHGLIDFLLSRHPSAVYILEHCIVKIVPMINVDGVIEGFYRIGLTGCDLNRMWEHPDPTFHPVVYNTKLLLRQIADERRVAAYIDFHGHARLNGTFLFGCPNPDDRDLRDTEKRLPRMLAFLSDAFSWGHCVFSCPTGRRGASRMVVRKEIGVVNSFTLETSFGGVADGPRAGVLYDENIWKEIGAKCGEAVYHLIVGEESTLLNYVTREIQLMNPPPTEEDEESERRVEVKSVEPEKCGGNKPGRNAPAGKIWSMAPPKKFLVADWGTISSEAPPSVAPAWEPMQFSPH
jgi:murein tripeptide amidase MpaA